MILSSLYSYIQYQYQPLMLDIFIILGLEVAQHTARFLLRRSMSQSFMDKIEQKKIAKFELTYQVAP